MDHIVEWFFSLPDWAFYLVSLGGILALLVVTGFVIWYFDLEVDADTDIRDGF